jgi:glycerol-3-phosphate acyltransferase PlsY
MVWIKNHFLPTLIVGLAAYFLGCLVAGYYLVRFVAHRDIRKDGSGNAGARNAGRLLGAWGFVTVFLWDFGKGAVAVWLARRFTASESLALFALLAVTAGHLWPAQINFQGGKGVSTSLGALLAYDWRIALTFAAAAALAWLLLRRLTLGGLVAFALLPLMALAWRQSPESIWGLLLVTALVLFAHRMNLKAVFFNPVRK